MSFDNPQVTESPDTIWLNYGDIERDCTHAECYRDGDVTWCQEPVFDSDVKYVRADLADNAAKDKRIAELEARLETSADTGVDGIEARDETIRLQDKKIASLEAKVKSLELGEEGAKEAFGHLVDQKRGLETEVSKLRWSLDAALAKLREPT